MERREIDVRVSRSQGGSFRFSLASMFIFTTALALALSGTHAGSDWTARLTAVLWMILAPMSLTVWLVYGRGYAKTFAMGGLFPAALFMFLVLPELLYSVRSGFDAPDPYFDSFGRSPEPEDVAQKMMILLALNCFAIVVTGLLAMGVRYMVESRDGVPSSGSQSGIDLGETPSDEEDDVSDVQVEDRKA